MAVATGVAGHRTALLAWSGRSRWPFILESFVQTESFRVGAAVLCTGWCYCEAVGLLLQGNLLAPAFLILDWSAPGEEWKPFPAHHSRNCWFLCLKCHRGALIPIWRSSHKQCLDEELVQAVVGRVCGIPLGSRTSCFRKRPPGSSVVLSPTCHSSHQQCGFCLQGLVSMANSTPISKVVPADFSSPEGRSL